jgi:TRAP-type C4-dicarboxylate transport system substrate-binding protein
VLAGLQTGLINAVVVPPLVALALQWHNHVEYMMNLPLLYIYSIMAVDNKAFAKITEPDQQIVLQVMNELYRKIDAENRIDNRKAYDALINQGITVKTPGPEDVPAWQDLAGKSIARLVESGKITPESLEFYNNLLNEFRQQVSSQAGASGE